MVKYCVANECPMYEDACANAAENGHLEILKYLREEVKAPWDWNTATWAAKNGHLHILEYLVERKFDEYDEFACEMRPASRPLGLFEVLTRNRQSAVGPVAVRERTRTTTPNVYNTSSTTTVHYQMVGDTKMESYTAWNQNQNQNKT